MGHALDLTTWNRRHHYELFRKYRQPFFSVCVDVDVTRLWRAAKRPGGPPLFLALLFFMLRAANETEALKLRLRGSGVWRHDRLDVGPTIMRSDGTFTFT